MFAAEDDSSEDRGNAVAFYHVWFKLRGVKAGTFNEGVD